MIYKYDYVWIKLLFCQIDNIISHMVASVGPNLVANTQHFSVLGKGTVYRGDTSNMSQQFNKSLMGFTPQELTFKLELYCLQKGFLFFTICVNAMFYVTWAVEAYDDQGYKYPRKLKVQADCKAHSFEQGIYETACCMVREHFQGFQGSMSIFYDCNLYVTWLPYQCFWTIITIMIIIILLLL